MFLAFKLSDIITIPFGWVLGQLYRLCGSYGLAMVFFAVIVYMVMLPITAKSKQSMMKMSRLQPKLQDIQKRYASDPQKQNEMVQKLYQEENVGMTGGCLQTYTWGHMSSFQVDTLPDPFPEITHLQIPGCPLQGTVLEVIYLKSLL